MATRPTLRTGKDQSQYLTLDHTRRLEILTLHGVNDTDLGLRDINQVEPPPQL